MIEFSITLEELKKAVTDLEIAQANGFNDTLAAFQLKELGNGNLNEIRCKYTCALPGVKLINYWNRWSRCGTEWLIRHRFDAQQLQNLTIENIEPDEV